jgi:hypothetical protein
MPNHNKDKINATAETSSQTFITVLSPNVQTLACYASRIRFMLIFTVKVSPLAN